MPTTYTHDVQIVDERVMPCDPRQGLSLGLDAAGAGDPGTRLGQVCAVDSRQQFAGRLGHRRAEIRPGKIDVEVFDRHRAISLRVVVQPDRGVILVVLVARAAAIDLAHDPIARYGRTFDDDPGDRGEFDLGFEADLQPAAGDTDIVEAEIEGLVLAHPGKEIEPVDNLLALQRDAEDAFARLTVVGLVELERDRVLAVGNRDIVSGHAITHRLVDRLLVGPCDGRLEMRNLAAQWAGRVGPR